jgi:hypothetical protein
VRLHRLRILNTGGRVNMFELYRYAETLNSVFEVCKIFARIRTLVRSHLIKIYSRSDLSLSVRTAFNIMLYTNFLTLLNGKTNLVFLRLFLDITGTGIYKANLDLIRSLKKNQIRIRSRASNISVPVPRTGTKDLENGF